MYGCSLFLGSDSLALALALALTLNSHTHTFTSVCMTFTSVWFAFYFHRSRRSPVIIYLNPSRRAFDWRALSVDIIYIYIYSWCSKNADILSIYENVALNRVGELCCLRFPCSDSLTSVRFYSVLCAIWLNWLSASVWFHSFVRSFGSSLSRSRARSCVSFFSSIAVVSHIVFYIKNFVFSPLHTGQCVLCLPGRVRLPFFGFHFHLATVRESTAREVVAFCS